LNPQQEGEVMKTMKNLVAIVVLGGAMLVSSGCATPAYSAGERGRLISRTWGYEWAQAQDDIDSALLLRPPGRMTIWNVR
jgi:hypothetical protein